jgi:hypothetical protein
MATLRSQAITLLRLDGHTNIAAANRHHARDPATDAEAASGRMSEFAVFLPPLVTPVRS